MKKITVLIAFLVLGVQNNYAQNVDSTRIIEKKDSSVALIPRNDFRRKTIVEDSFPNPRKAFLWSIIPGGGQIYNKKLAWLKLPIVYGALGTGVYVINFNTNQYRRFKLAYSERVNGIKPFSDASIPQSIETTRLKQIRDATFKNLQQSYVLTIAGYLLAGVEAFTSAHLAHFDVRDDLSFHVKPSFEPVPMQGSAVGLGLQLKF
jgi:Family of unknown function (DUF5683)